MAGAEMAEALGDHQVASTWRRMAKDGRTWIDENLFNDSYFTQRIELTDRTVLDPYAGVRSIASLDGWRRLRSVLER